MFIAVSLVLVQQPKHPQILYFVNEQSVVYPCVGILSDVVSYSYPSMFVFLHLQSQL